MDFKESLKKLRSMSDEEVVTMVEKATGKALVSYEGIDALIAALMGFYNGELKKKSPTGHKHAKEDITNFPSSMPPTAHTHDDRYNTKDEINNKLSTKVNTSDIVDNLTDNSQNKALSARQGKILNDNKLDKADEWRINAKELLNLDVTLDLNDYKEAGIYRCPRDIQKWKNLPPGFPNGAFNLIVVKISKAYTTQMIFSYYKPQYYIRVFYDGIISPWQQITMLNPDGNFEIGATNIIAGSYNYGFTCKNQNGINIYSLFISDKDKRLHLGKDNAVPITLDASDVKIQNSTVWHSGNFGPNSKLNKGSLPTKVGDAKGLYDLIENNSGLNFDPNLLFLNDAGTKYVNKIYFDRNKKGMFKCIAQTTATTNSTSYFVDISNNANSDQLRNLGKVKSIFGYSNQINTTSHNSWTKLLDISPSVINQGNFITISSTTMFSTTKKTLFAPIIKLLNSEVYLGEGFHSGGEYSTHIAFRIRNNQLQYYKTGNWDNYSIFSIDIYQ